MTKHLADRRTPTDGGRLVAFAMIARRSDTEGGHPAAQALVRRARGGGAAQRLAQFLRIARGRET
jgi:hypothetical protein